MTTGFDAIVIGTGQAGPALAARLSGAGMKVAVIERKFEVVHSLLDVMYAKAPYTTVSRAMQIHPTVSELVPTLLQGMKPLG